MKVEFSGEDLVKMEKFSRTSDSLTIDFNLSDALGFLQCEADVSVSPVQKDKEAGSRSKINGGLSAWEYFQNLCESQRQRRELEKERDWWRKRAFKVAELLDDERHELNMRYGGVSCPAFSVAVSNLKERAAELGYEVPE